MTWLDYREKLGLGFCDEEKVGFVITNLISYVKVMFSRIGVQKFVFYMFDTSSPISQKELAIGHEVMDEDRGNAVANILLSHQDTLEDFLSYFMPLINRCDEKDRDEHKEFLETMLKAAHIPYEIFKDTNGYFVFPKGAQELDNALVSEPLEWLKEYPKSYKTYCIALRQYSEEIYIRDVADNLRKALEDFLREFLNNNNDLNKNKKFAEAYLKQANADPQLVNMFGSLLTHYYLLNNEIAKHSDKVDKTYLEFLLYQTGVFIRMLIVVKRENKEAPNAN